MPGRLQMEEGKNKLCCAFIARRKRYRSSFVLEIVPEIAERFLQCESQKGSNVDGKFRWLAVVVTCMLQLRYSNAC